MTSHEIRKDLNLTQEQFASKFNIPLGTVLNWDARGCMPKYIYNILSEYKLYYELCLDLEREILEYERERDKYYENFDLNL